MPVDPATMPLVYHETPTMHDDASITYVVRLPNFQLLRVRLRSPHTTEGDLRRAIAAQLAAGYVTRGAAPMPGEEESSA